MNFDKDTAATILTCMLHVHMSNIAQSGSYNTEINKLFNLNRLPKVHLPDNPPSLDILSMANARTEEEVEEHEADDREEGDRREGKRDKEEEKEEEMPQLEQVNRKAIGLEIFIKNSGGWSKET